MGVVRVGINAACRRTLSATACRLIVESGGVPHVSPARTEAEGDNKHRSLRASLFFTHACANAHVYTCMHNFAQRSAAEPWAPPTR